MNILVSLRTDLIKLRRSAALWLSILGAGLIPLMFLIAMLVKPNGFANRLQDHPWQAHLGQGWEAFAGFLLPMFVILICSLATQIEYKNNTWKQVFASPQSIAQIFFSKFLSIALMILLLIFLFNLFLLGAGWIAGMVHPKLSFSQHAVPWQWLFSMAGWTLLSLMGIFSIQYWFSLRFKNFIVPIGLGLGLLIISMIAMNWEHVDKVPYAFPFLAYGYGISSLGFGNPPPANFFGYSLVYFAVFTLLAFLDMKLRRERG